MLSIWTGDYISVIMCDYISVVIMSDDEAEYLDSLTDQLEEEEHDEAARKNLLSDLDSEAAAALPPKASSSGIPPDKEHMKIFLRVRPFSTPEIISGENQVRRELFNFNLTVLWSALNFF